MQFPESWLREFCNPPLNTQELADTLTMAGLEVEELQPVAPPFTKIVVGEIKDAQQRSGRSMRNGQAWTIRSSATCPTSSPSGRASR